MGRCAFFPCAETLSKEAAGQLHEGAAGAGDGGVRFSLALGLWPRRQRGSCARRQQGLGPRGGVRFSLVLRLWPRRQRGRCARRLQGLEPRGGVRFSLVLRLWPRRQRGSCTMGWRRCGFCPCAETLSQEAAGQLREEAAGAGANGRCALFSCAETVSNEAAGQLREEAAWGGSVWAVRAFPLC